LEESVRLPLLNESLPGGLRHGANYLVEFDPHSLWYETSLTLCAQALRLGIRTDYHTFTHPPADIRRQLGTMGVPVKDLEDRDEFRIWDSFAVQTGALKAESIGRVTPREFIDLRSVKMSDWEEHEAKQLQEDVAEVDMRRLHIDDNTSVLVQFNDERSVAEHFRTHTVPLIRRLELAAVHAVVKGTYSEGFYSQFEAFCDGIIDLKATEEGGRIAHSIRVRLARGAGHDSRWRRLQLQGNGEVTYEAGSKGLESGSGEDEEVEGERRLAAIVFTDVVGFTAMAQADEPMAMRLLTEQRAMFRPIIAKHRGREVKTIGDAFLVEFASSLDAVRCAIEIQATMKDFNSRRGGSPAILIRIGIHLGDVIHSENDVAGDAVNVASRIEPLAPPGGICVTAPVHSSVVNKVPFSFESLGTPRLKNVATPMEVFRIKGLGEAAAKPVQMTAAQSNRVAVLPFANFSADRADEYFAEGMTEELISSVSKTGGLRAIARTSVMKYKGTTKPISEIGRELNVGSVLEGSVRKAGDKVRITVQLVDAASEEPKWSQEYDRELKDVLVIQTDIALKVAEALRVHVLGVAAEPKTTVNTAAYVYYLRGRQEWNRRNQESLVKAVGLFEEALKIDGSYAKAYSGLADSYATLALLELVPPREAYPKAKEAIGRALSLDPTLAEAHTSLGLARFQYDWDWKGAEEEFNEAIRINPSYAPSHHFYADYLKAMGRFDEAVAEIGRAQELDPLNLAINTGVGHVLYLSKQYDRAIDQYRKAVDLDPNFTLTHIWFGRPYLEKGMYPEAISELETAVKLSGEGTLALAMLGHGLASAGRKEDSKKILDQLLERSKTRYVPSYWVAVVYNGFKDREETLKWLRRAFDERSSWLVWCNVEPRFDWLRGDSEFASLMKDMKFP